MTLQRPMLVYLQALLPSVNPTERVIGEYVLQDPERILSSTISQVRNGSGASVGSIIAFCRRLGLKGFTDFKIALAQELAQAGFSASAKVSKEDSSIIDDVFQYHTQSLQETLQINSEKTLMKVAKTLEAASRIEFFSIGLSFPVAYTACCKFQLIGLPASTHMDSHMQIVTATQLRKGDLAFGISISGSTTETVRCLEIARQNHATTVCLTNCMKSPITSMADLALYATPSEIKYFQAPLAARITQLALVDVLFVYIALRRKNKTMKYLQRAGEKLLEHRI